MSKYNNIPNIPAEKFQFVGVDMKRHDQKFETKQISYFRDAFNRFCKNKSSVVAGIIILCLVLYAIFVPVFCETSYSKALTDTTYLQYTKLRPRNQLFVDMGLGFWDGCATIELGDSNKIYIQGIGAETGYEVIKEELSVSKDTDGKTMTKCRVDSYINNGFMYMTLSPEEYQAIQAWQNETGLQVIYPAITDNSIADANIWYQANKKGVAKLDANGNYVNIYRTSGVDGDYNSTRIDGDPG